MEVPGPTVSGYVERMDAGESVTDLAEDYDLSTEEIMAAVLYERASPARRADGNGRGLRAPMLDLPDAPLGRYAAAATPVLRALRGAGGFLPGGT
jgi:hypothetical protein